MYHLCHITADCDVHNCHFDTYAEAEAFARVVLAEDGGTATIGTNGYSRTLWANDDGTCHVGGYDYSYVHPPHDDEEDRPARPMGQIYQTGPSIHPEARGW